MLFAVIVALGAPALSMAQVRTPDEQRRRDQIRIMEGVLVQAVRLGAENVSRQLERFEPAGVTVLSGVPRARGFVLEGYGVFFDVEIPDMNQSVIWSMMNIQRDRVVGNALDSLRAEIEAMAQGPNRDRAQVALQQVTKTVGPAPPPRGAQSQDRPPQGQVEATAAAMPDPDKLYSESVKAALVDVMLDHSLRMTLGPDEWLTVAARASEGPMPPAGLSDLITIVMRVKGSDLSVYQADPTKRDEIRERVRTEARVF
ncbi:MAG: hypothetical protein ABW292_04200 [Vicinamibacterales bacterium]